jgi:DNA-binding NarL/FixJ family response regulator
MAISSPEFITHLHSKSHQPRCSINPVVVDPMCLIHSNHPLARCLITDALCSDPRLRFSVWPYSKDSKALNGEKRQILLLDTCSVENWAGCLAKWRLQGGLTIALVSSETRTSELELQMLYLGATGVLTFVGNLIDQLPRAIHAVAEGRLWIRREVLNAYVRRASNILRKAVVPEEKLTLREREISDLLQQELSNRSIAKRLTISERTVKFHVSNILRKMNVANRRELQALSSSAMLFCPGWLQRQDPLDVPPPQPYAQFTTTACTGPKGQTLAV